MPLLQVVSSKPRAGKTALAVGLAQGLAKRGKRVQLLRVGASEDAKRDAATFGNYLFASSPREPIAESKARVPRETVGVVELEAGGKPQQAAAILVVGRASGEEDGALGKALGDRLIGTIATCVEPARIDEVARGLTDAGLRPLAVIPEDARLAGPSVADIRRALAADVLYEGENAGESIDEVLVAPVYTDGAKLHFQRYAGANAVLAPSYKTDLLLAAIEATASCLIITGGHPPSHYVLDRVQGEPTTVLLAQQQTPAAVASLSDVWAGSAFTGEAKAEVILSYLEPRLDWDGLAKRLF